MYNRFDMSRNDVKKVDTSAMTDNERLTALLGFFKALADENRLRIVGLLAQQPCTVGALAAELGLGISTTSHHLSKLAKAGLVAARAEGHYYLYSLQADRVRSMAQRLLQEGAQLPGPADDSMEDAFERKVIATFTDESGRITAFPAQQKKVLVLLRHVLKAFEPGVRYPEKKVNEILSRYNADTARLRRSLVEFGMMDREGGGGAYWRIVGNEGHRLSGRVSVSRLVASDD